MNGSKFLIDEGGNRRSVVPRDVEVQNYLGTPVTEIYLGEIFPNQSFEFTFQVINPGDAIFGLMSFELLTQDPNVTVEVKQKKKGAFPIDLKFTFNGFVGDAEAYGPHPNIFIIKFNDVGILRLPVLGKITPYSF